MGQHPLAEQNSMALDNSAHAADPTSETPRKTTNNAEEQDDDTKHRLVALKHETSMQRYLIEALREKVVNLEAEVNYIHTRLDEIKEVAVSREPAMGVLIPEPRFYGGERSVYEVEDFLFGMEHYFRAAEVRDEARKVSIATLYLMGEARLWWRTMYSEIEAFRVRIDTWDQLREAIRLRFRPGHVID